MFKKTAKLVLSWFLALVLMLAMLPTYLFAYKGEVELDGIVTGEALITDVNLLNTHIRGNTPPMTISTEPYIVKSVVDKKKYPNASVETFTYDVSVNTRINVFYSLPNEITDQTRVIVVMTGTNRNANSYASTFSYLANAANIAVIVPEFSEDVFDRDEYNWLNITKDGKITAYDEWTFIVVDDVFAYFIDEYDINAKKYILYGHSAGSQFTVRTSMFSKSEYLDYAIAANAGTYTFLDETIKYPHGISNLIDYKNTLLNNLTNRRIIIYLQNLFM